MATILDRVVEVHRAAARRDRRPLDRLTRQAEAMPAPRSFRRCLLRADGISVIAEIKRRSPSKGDLAPDLDAASLAQAYEAGGASCLSVLTDADFFGGSAADLSDARSACSLPVLRKDFTVAEADVLDARLMGADAVLLIAAVLADDELGRLREVAERLGMAAVVEVHDLVELRRALAAGADVIGVNQRDLRTFAVDPTRAASLVRHIPTMVAKVAESGIRGGDDAARLSALGYDAILVGESLVTAADPRRAVAQLREAVTFKEGLT